MGSAMALRLAQAAHEVTVWNRTPSKSEALAGAGVRVAHALPEAVRDAKLVFTMLSTGAAVDEVLQGLLEDHCLSAGTGVIDMSSIPPATARSHALQLEARGVSYLDAPVSGGTIGAAEGTLAIMAGGDAETFARFSPILCELGRPTHVGPAGSGQLTKLSNQVIVAITIGAVSEALFLAEAGGANPEAVREALMGGFADSRILREHGQRMLKREWRPGGSAEHQLKDLNAILGVADEIGLRLPMTMSIHGLFERMNEDGFGDYDHSALLMTLEKLNGASGVRVGTAPDQIP